MKQSQVKLSQKLPANQEEEQVEIWQRMPVLPGTPVPNPISYYVLSRNPETWYGEPMHTAQPCQVCLLGAYLNPLSQS